MSNPLPNSLALSVINTNDPINSAPLRNDFASVQTAVNQLIACLSGGTAGQLLSAVDGTDVQYINNIRYRVNSIQTVVNTVTETDLLGGLITVGANVLGSANTLRLTASGTMLNNSGSTQASPRFKLKLGSTTIIDTGALAAAWAASANIGTFKLMAEITNMGATNSQRCEFNLDYANSLAANVIAVPTTGSGIHSTQSSDFGKALVNGSGAVDTTSSQALVFSVILPAANANLSMNLTSALVEII